jgi:hypothetical protein
MPMGLVHCIQTAGTQWPDASTTGYSGSLTAVPGSATSGTGWSWDGGDQAMYITGTGVTVTGYDVSGIVIIQGDNVTFSNCKVTSDDVAGVWVNAASGVTIEDCEVLGTGDGDSVGQNVVWVEGPNCTVSRCDLSAGENGIMLAGTDALIEDNYIHDLIPENIGGGAEPHTDGIQVFTDNECDGSTITGNNVIAPSIWSTSAIIIGTVANLTVHNNRFRGGFAVFRAYMDNTNIYTNNRIGDDGGAGLADDNGGAGTPTWSGNVNDDTDETIPMP